MLKRVFALLHPLLLQGTAPVASACNSTCPHACDLQQARGDSSSDRKGMTGAVTVPAEMPRAHHSKTKKYPASIPKKENDTLLFETAFNILHCTGILKSAFLPLHERVFNDLSCVLWKRSLCRAIYNCCVENHQTLDS